MTFEMVSGLGVVHCDECSECIETDKDNLNDAMAEAKRQKWVVFKGPDGKWAHACPSCHEDWKVEQLNRRG
jgi:hypothetical protein